MFFRLITVCLVFLHLSEGHQLGSRCHMDEDCTTEVMSSRCEDGECQCLPHYVSFNNSMCIQGTLLGFSCILDSQCKDRVENSSCEGGTCRCNKGYIPFKRHACLAPARLGQICYSDEQCRMWDSDSSCDYIIRNVIGRCRCSAQTRQVGVACLAKNEGSAENRPRALTLGLKCSSDDQCLSADPNSRCLNGVCDCLAPRNASARIPRCSALNPGCYPGTFQCKSSGECVSWFFVCDGRAHCADQSDEEGCAGPVCPSLSFTCASGGCVSRASVCDGTKDCPGGEDEIGCKGERTCPAFTLRCRGSSPRCIPEYELCNAVKTCEDGSDELRSVCRGKSTLSGKRPRAAGVTNTASCPFRCGNGRCRSSAVVCSGRDGCGDNSDEIQCTVCKCPSV